MARKFGGYEKAKEAARYQGSEQLPIGAYVCVILGAKYFENPNGDRIEIQFDIAEGDQKDFFQKQFNANPNEDKKYKGRTTIFYPKDDGSESDEWTKNTFSRWVNAIEDSNPGYSWDWDERKWKGKKLGIVFSKTGTNIDGKDVIYVEAHGPASVKQVHDGTFYSGYLKFKKRPGYRGDSDTPNNSNNNYAAPAPTYDQGFMSIPDGIEEELPFA